MSASANLSPDELHDLLSAYVDNEVTPEERAMVDELVATDHDARQLLDDLEGTALFLRDLPDVTPRRPIEDITARPAQEDSQRKRFGIRSVRSGMAAIVGAAAIWLLVLTFTGAETIPGVPDIEALSTRHAQAMEVESVDFMPMEVDEITMVHLTPDSIDGMEREGIYQQDKLIHAVFYDGAHVISVFHEPGEVDWDGLPAGQMMEMEGEDGMEKAWYASMDDKDVVVTEMDGQMVTIVADGDIGTDMVLKIPSLLHA